ncbi:type II toxin-antitoxin system mRNA interferase toxin, RelE/StbE family [Azospirillum sp. B4]|uniref:type II toxin-antitoxin system RelE/ParE family toxin n=1 Tax=Azospirillum sp. B4 TaxID=95605 RepID=UPI0003448E83|nr:type II toxin-antitoxin system mRNA interferase toxin, RelE/StbE family [Azospirillum sp. B4]
MKLIWTRPANIDRKAIRDYIAQEKPAAALALDELFSEKALLLTKHSAIGRPGRIVGTRELVVHRNYILIYRVDGDAVRILSLVHTARQWPPIR